MYWPESTFDIIVCFLLKKKKRISEVQQTKIYLLASLELYLLFLVLLSLIHFLYPSSPVFLFSLLLLFFFIFLAFAICYSTFVRPFFLFSYHVFFPTFLFLFLLAHFLLVIPFLFFPFLCHTFFSVSLAFFTLFLLLSLFKWMQPNWQIGSHLKVHLLYSSTNQQIKVLTNNDT